MEKMNYLFTSESVSEGHPDKVADQISDAILDQFLAFDPESKVACETLVTTGQVVLAGEVKSQAYIDLPEVARRTIKKIGYHKSEYMFDADSCGVLTAIHEQSGDINRGVDRSEKEAQGAGDQGMMFGYACTETPSYLPLTLDLAHLLLIKLAKLRKGHVIPYLRPDAKSQVTVEYDGETHKPVRIHTIVISTQHDDFVNPMKEGITQEEADKQMHDRIYNDVKNVLLPALLADLPEATKALFDDKLILLVNPTGKFVIGGPHGDTGLTGRKIIVDARHIAKNAVAAGIADEMLVQISYAIGQAEPVNFFVDTYGTSKVKESDAEIAEKLKELFPLTPFAIEQRLKLRQPIYEETAAYGHMGRKPKVVTKHFASKYERKEFNLDVELFTWEKLDYVDQIKEKFHI